ETDSAEANRLLTTVALKGAKRPKLMKMIVSQRTSTASKGMETEPVSCSYISQRVFRRSIPILSAWLWNERCASSFGARPCILALRISAAGKGGGNPEALVPPLDQI